MEKNRSSKSVWNAFTIVLLVLLIVYVICLLTPLLWAFITSFKDYRTDYRVNVIGLPKQWIFSNYPYVFEKMSVKVDVWENGVQKTVGVLEMYGYSILYAVGCSFMATLAPCLTAYCCSKFPCQFSKIIYTVVIVCMVLPIVGNLPSEIRVAQALGVYGHIWGLWIMKFGFLGMYFLVFYATFNGIPVTYTEAAKIDGAGNWKIFLEIILPLVQNTFFTVMLIKFIEFWNDYQTPLIYMGNYPTISLGLYHALTGSANNMTEEPKKMAAAMLVFIPILAVFLIFQERFLGDLMVGGVKG